MSYHGDPRDSDTWNDFDEPEEWVEIDDYPGAAQNECPMCGAEPGACCSEPDPDHPGLGIELTHTIHTSRVH